MKYHFFIEGIHCQNCIEKITTLLQDKLQATNIKFSQDNLEINFESGQTTMPSELNSMLRSVGEYKVKEINPANLAMQTEEPPSYKPIYLLFAYLLIGNILILLGNFNLEKLMINFMASFFLVFSFFKLLDLKGFADGYSSYDLLSRKFYQYGYIYPFLELGFGIGYLLLGNNLYLNIAVFIVMLVSSVGVIRAKLSKQQFVCACVGTFLKVPLGTVAIIEDISMTLMSLTMIVMALL